jgi:hypothetical protein
LGEEKLKFPQTLKDEGRPLTRPAADLSPKGEVMMGRSLAWLHLSLGGEVAA